MIKNGLMQVHSYYRVHYRFIIRMKLTLIITVFAVVNTMANAYSQQKVSLDVQKTKLSRILKLIEEKSDYYFVYSATNANLNKELSLNVENAKVVDLLPRLFNKTGLQYSVSEEGLVVVTEKQQAQVRGVVVDEKGNGLAGATVRVKGSQIARATDLNGRFSIDATSANTLVISFAGYGTQEVAAGSAEMKIVLHQDLRMLNEVVVTALGVAKEKRSLGYSVTQVQGESLTQARENNVINSLVGKVAGLDISSTAGGAGSASNVTIRGVSSLNQTNQPLYVINGVPMESRPVGIGNLNSRGNKGSQWDNAPDLGDAIGNLNPDDIESISVLKGAAASALYGYRAKAGVILITTKTGKGSSIDFSSNFVGERIIDQTDWQTTYGQGTQGQKPTSAAAAALVGASSWGGKLDGSDVVQFDGTMRPYSYQKGNLGRFYRTGSTWTNTIALNKSFEGGTIRLSASDVSNRSVVPNSGLDRQSFSLVGTFEPFKRFTIDARINQILEGVKNRPMVSDGAGNANYNVMFLPTSINVNDLKPWKDEKGFENKYNTGNTYNTNPWFAAYEFQNNTKRDRNISSITARYTLENGLFFQGRAGRDGYSDQYKHVVPSGTGYYEKGKISEQQTTFEDINVDVLLGKTFNAGDYSITPNLGASYRHTTSSVTTNNGVDFAVFGVYNLLNAENKSVDIGHREEETQSTYGTLEFAYKDIFYLTGSVRSDWFSTLATPGVDNKLNVVYPSVSGSFVFSEYVKPSWLNFGKLRAGYAKVGQATDPYQTVLMYNFRSENLDGKQLGIIDNKRIPNTSLKASSASELEFGTELRLLNDRLSLDVTWYNKKSKDEISFITTPSSSGYEAAVLNAGEIQNKGVEMLLSATIIKKDNFRWISSVNGSYNDNKVLSLAEGMDRQLIATSRAEFGSLMMVKGMPVNQVMAFDYKYDANGEIVYKSDGTPERGELMPYGSSINKWFAGWNNEFMYKNFNLSFLIDGKWGGKMFSATDYYGFINGLHKETLEKREELGTLAPTYYRAVADNVSKRFVNSTDFIKLRQVILGYKFPANMFNNRVKSLGVSLVARNLLVLKRKTNNVDPESSYNATFPGLELGGVPAVRTFGANLSVKF
ncbi:SusC/RagA family TonB-linked outer membrane protein [Sphingobacterium psychroaquaticum]|uniref:TonB-linked outer membrane protein, SusC/RagA family n=1 Tax=Sphingobacterium psychroaquaticum TaxID=561061 RepID=A0A1X7JSN2_9SPHI|nr:SusC/RagA family TonB-linked outer membrane protein [Sphingobacterium psychroaquaticum]SMG31382.1 TonB-linked outer membrane protein, SusC/RagA family [Sphingobacterium psychroaquaticum]